MMSVIIHPEILVLDVVICCLANRESFLSSYLYVQIKYTCVLLRDSNVAHENQAMHDCNNYSDDYISVEVTIY